MLSIILTLVWLLPLLSLSLCVSAYSPGSGSVVYGDLSVAAPYGVPPSRFKSETSNLKPNEAAVFNITGYDLATDSAPQSVNGWRLQAGVKERVSLSDAGATSSSASKDQAFAATTLYIQAPDNMIMDDSWKMCAAVYPGLASSPAPSAELDGSCSGLLPPGCLRALAVAAGGASSNGMDTNGRCTHFVLPSRCTAAFPSDSLNTTAITINQTVLDNNRFYAYGSDPVDPGDATTVAGEQARLNVWAVITIWGHLSASGARSSTNVGVQCIRATGGATDAHIGASGTGRPRVDPLVSADLDEL